MKYHTGNGPATQNLGEKLAHQLIPKTGVILALFGDLGSGKTTFVQGLAHGLGIKEKIISPSFILIRHYSIPHSGKTLYHIDLYRLDNPHQLKNLGLEEIFTNPNNLTAIEWAEKLGDQLPPQATKIVFRSLSENDREIEIKKPQTDNI